jgi:DNA-directed RNA polymerase specialized sigma24 family protein/predicted RNA-binding protein with PUA-like domain
MIDALITGLSKGLELSAEEIADTLWLALQIEESQPELGVRAELRENPPQPTLEQGEPEVLPAEISTHPSELEETASNQPPDEPKAGIYPRNPQESLVGSGLSLRVPDAPSLREPLTLARALKPLMRRMPSGSTLVLDEAATTQQIAETGLWLPVLKPTLEPWLDLELVVDEGISMQIWRHTIGELERLLKNYGIFRDVRVWGLISDDSESSDLPRLVQIRRGIGATAKNQSPRSPAELIDPSGRRLILVVSDCVSPQWRDGKLTATLELWAKQGSMAIVQMLPKWLWKRTALGRASEVRLQGLNPGEFNQKLIAKGVSLWDELDETRGVKVPVFTLEPDRVATWAQMLSGKGSTWTAGYVFKLDPLPAMQGKDLFNRDVERQSAEQRVQAFRVTASPMARKLAGLLAAAPVISLPIVRLIQETLLKESQQVHVAEVFLGGLLKPLSEINPETNPNYVQYEFMDGVRELLADSVPSGYVLDVVDAVSKYVARKLGLSLEEFAAILQNPQQVTDSETAEQVRYFATVTTQVLRHLGGEYTSFADNLEKHNSKNKNQLNIKQYWIFQGNPKYYRVLDCIRDFEQVYWLVTRYAKDINIGDEVFIWISGQKAGVYAIGEIIKSVEILNEVPDNDYWIVDKKSRPEEKRILLNFTTKLIKSPLLREEIIQDSLLKSLSIIASPQGTNFKVTKEQWQRINALIKLDLKAKNTARNLAILDLLNPTEEEINALALKVKECIPDSIERRLSLNQLVKAINNSKEFLLFKRYYVVSDEISEDRTHRTKIDEMYENAMQETWMYIIKSFDYVIEKENFFSYFRGVLKYKILDSNRNYKKTKEIISLDEITTNYPSESGSYLDYLSERKYNDLSPNSYEDLINAIEEDVGNIFKNVHIDNNQKANFQAIMLLRLQGKTWKEVADLFHVDLSIIKKFFHKSAKEFRYILEKYW